MSNKYNAQFYIDFFSKIPEELWIEGDFEDECGRKCAYGHLGERYYRITEEARGLKRLSEDYLPKNFGFMKINDNKVQHEYPQETPKQRVLAALERIKLEEKKT